MKHKKQSEMLSAEDIAFLPTLAKYLRTLKGEARAQHNRAIQARFSEQFNGVSRGRLTSMIYEIRVRKLVRNLVAGPNGFYVTLDSDIIKSYSETLERHIKARRESLRSFGDSPGKGLKMRYKVGGYYRGKKYIKGYYRMAPGYAGHNQMTINFEVPASGKKSSIKTRNNPGQLKMF